MGFEQELDSGISGNALVSAFEQLKESWKKGRDEYASFVDNCILKDSAYIHREKYQEFLDNVLLNDGGVSPASLEILEYMRASKLRKKAKFKESEKPDFAHQAEAFWAMLESFGRAVRVDCIRYLEKKPRSGKFGVGYS